jgi:hypothetical protein
MKTLTKASVVFETGWVHNNVTISLLVLPVFVLVTFVGSCSVGADPYDADCVWVATGNVDQIVRHVFAAEGDDIKPKVWFAGDR